MQLGLSSCLAVFEFVKEGAWSGKSLTAHLEFFEPYSVPAPILSVTALVDGVCCDPSKLSSSTSFSAYTKSPGRYSSPVSLARMHHMLLPNRSWNATWFTLTFPAPSPWRTICTNYLLNRWIYPVLLHGTFCWRTWPTWSMLLGRSIPGPQRRLVPLLCVPHHSGSGQGSFP